MTNRNRWRAGGIGIFIAGCMLVFGLSAQRETGETPLFLGNAEHPEHIVADFVGAHGGLPHESTDVITGQQASDPSHSR